MNKTEVVELVTPAHVTNLLRAFDDACSSRQVEAAADLLRSLELIVLQAGEYADPTRRMDIDHVVESYIARNARLHGRDMVGSVVIEPATN